MNALAPSVRQPISKASLAWKLTLILIPLLTGVTLFWLRHLEVAHLTARRINSYGQVPSFRLTNQESRPFGSEELRGKIWIADFIYTTCPGPCPMISTRMGELEKPLKGTDVQLVSFSVDPARDTPEVLRGYAENLHADAHRWNFLTGNRRVIYALIQDGFKLGVSDGSEELAQPVHSSRVALVDRRGTIRGYYDATAPDTVTKLLADTNHLLREQPR